MFWKADNPLRTYGDPYSDWSILQAGTFFAKEGFVENYFLPKRNSIPPVYYTHYPPLPDLLNGVVQRLGFDRMRHFRFLPIMASLLGLAFWWVFLARAISAWIATISLFAMAFSPMFYRFADSLHEHSYSIFFLFASFYFWREFCESRGRDAFFYGLLAWSMAFLQSLASFEYILLTHVFFFGYAWLISGERIGRWPWIMVSAPTAGFALHVLQNAWQMGGLQAAVWDLTDAFLYRTFSIGSQSALPLPSLAAYLEVTNQRLESVLPDPVRVLGLLALGLLWFYGERFQKFPESAMARTSLRMVLVLGAGGISWWITFPQHTWIHAAVARHIAPAVVLLLASGIVVAVRVAWRIRRMNRAVALTLWVFSAGMAGFMVYPTTLSLRLWNPNSHFHHAQACSLDRLLPKKAAIITPQFPQGLATPPIMYYTNRPYIMIAPTTSLEIMGAVCAVQAVDSTRPCFYMHIVKLEDSPLCRFLMQYGVETYHYEENKIVIEVYELNVPAILELLERQSAGRASAAPKSKGELP
ncbi:MAG: hypothetical protein JSV08_07440 [Acidobacteriota bacterium]|nr:MAG: hypothetical protein JSV08_07440 [Acidobacteriota bacterium]